MTPTDWNVGHQIHHRVVGDTTQAMYEWGETIFHTKSEFLRMSPWRRRVWRVLRWPPLFFPLASLGTWYLKFRIPYEWVLRGVPGARVVAPGDYGVVSKAVSTFFMGLRYVNGTR